MENILNFDRNIIFKYGTIKHLEDTVLNNSLDFNNAELLEVLYENTPSKIDTAELAILYEQLDNQERIIYKIEGMIKNPIIKEKEKELLKGDLKIYSKGLGGVYLKK
jgi:hypothetical protein